MATDKTEPSFQAGESASGLASLAKAQMAWLREMEDARREERLILESLLQQQTQEQWRTRRSKNWFRFFLGAYLVLVLALAYAKDLKELLGNPSALIKDGHTAIVDIRGTIMPGSDASADSVLANLKEAFQDGQTRGVILRINSPGGSPVQAGQIYDEIQRLRKLHPTIPVYAVLEDLCASGGYYVASAATAIYADKASLVGSIGVVMHSFGVQKLIEHWGIESRTLTAGAHKDFLDPFSPVKEDERAFAQGLLDKIHNQFILAVKTGRGNRLKAQDVELFNGLIWTGEEAVNLGLVDGLGDASWVARDLIKAETTVKFSKETDWFSRLSKKWLKTTLASLEWTPWGMAIP